MLNKPNLSDDLIATRLQRGFGISPSRIEFLPIGNDSASFVYRVVAQNGVTYFLKARKGEPYAPSVLVPRCLQDGAVPQALAPLRTLSGGYWEIADAFTLLLYPFVDGRDANTVGMSEAQWRNYGAIVRAIHASTLPADVRALVPVETFEIEPRYQNAIGQLNTRIGAGEFDGAALSALAGFWRHKRSEIDAIVSRTTALGQTLRRTAPPFVLCHADIHTANILVATNGDLHVVDWDGPMIAPKERDLMFVCGAGCGLPVTPRQHDLFMQGYGAIETDINWLALAYYRYNWVAQELAEYGRAAFLMKDIGEDAKAAMRALPRLFEPGNIVESAYLADAHLK